MSDKKKTLGGLQKRRKLLIVLCVVLAVILVALVSATVYLEYLMGKIGRTQDTSQPALSQEEIDAIQNPDETDPDNSSPFVNPDDVTWAHDPATHIGGDHIVNILLIGQDRREGESRARSDSMILCTFNIEKKTLTMTSFMRDMYVPIPGYLDNRINAAYQLGGSELLDETLYQNFGVEIDGNVEVDFSQFQEIIDLLGGVDIELTGEEAAYLNRNGNWDVDSSSAGNWYLTKGMNHLTGEQALAYSRIRYIGNGDYGRTSRQRTVLNALIQAYKNTSLTKMLLLLDDVLPLVTTDMTDKEIIGYATDLFPLLASSTITSQRIPADGAYYDASIRGMSVLVPDLAENRQLLIDSLSPQE
ncbi:MAG: LCP family protein [Oscillospiraceae bacterium]|nr:LCP family protein [Oscillospiraceae bacterium]